jgi:hypothetical protein
MKSFITELVLCLLMAAFIIISGCHNDAENSQYGNDPKSDTTVNGAAKTTDMDYGIVKQQEDFGHGNPAAHNQKTVDADSIRMMSESDSTVNPQNDPAAMQKSNQRLSGTGTSGHSPPGRPMAPAGDPNNKAKRDTVKYK